MKMRFETGILKREVELYVKYLVPSNASNAQMEDTIRAFYTGAYVMFEILNKIAELPEDVAVEATTFIDKELRDWVKDNLNRDIKYGRNMETTS